MGESLSHEGVVGRSADRLGGCGAKVLAPVSDMLGVRFGYELNSEVNRNGGFETTCWLRWEVRLTCCMPLMIFVEETA